MTIGVEKRMGYPTFRVDDRIALVTGAGRGIGRAVAEGLANAGATVVATDADPEHLPEVESRLRELGRPGLALSLDVRDRAAIQQVMDRVLGNYGRLDILVNNAGARASKPALELTLKDWEYVFDVNVTAVFLLSRAAAEIMKERGGGSIINVSSNNAVVVQPNRTAYCASKAAVLQMTRVMALEWAPYKIRVNAVGPGSILTPFTQEVIAAGKMRAAFQHGPMGRAACPDELIGTFVYLASDAASFVTGSFLVADGGGSLSWE
jgi:2-deoxy-D-gluconate 3-dehydrogenase